jgi:hypothetical protein
MSIKLGLRTVGIKDLVGTYIREHSGEIAIVGIMVTIIVGVTAITAGDIMQALARSRSR